MVENNPKQLIPPSDLRSETMEKMRQLFSETINAEDREGPVNGGKQFAREGWLLHHLRIIVSYHLEEDQAERDRIEREKIWQSQEEGAGVGFNPEQIGCLNFLVLEEKQKGRSQLVALLQKLEKKGAK